MKTATLFGPLLLLCALPAAAWDADLRMTIPVPLDRQHPDLGNGRIEIELGAPFDPRKPVVLVVADAQQFYVRRGGMKKIQDELFGPGFNVAGVYGRGTGDAFLAAALDAEGKPDWRKAWGIFESGEWVEDLETTRKAIAGPEGKVLLYGQSGGAFLVHQYLARYGAKVARAVTPSAVNPFLTGELGLLPDRFPAEIAAIDPQLPGLLDGVLARRPADRARIVMTLQRQNFFVPAEQLPAARAELIRALARGDQEAFAEAAKDYQVDQVSELFDSKAGIPIRVRLFEFVAPAGWLDRLGEDGVHPDLENQRNFAAPLLELWRQGSIPTPEWDKKALHRLETEVLVLAGTEDHTVDYRTSIALSSLYPRGKLVLLKDDHQFHALKANGTLAPMIQSFLEGGSGGKAFASALADVSAQRWKGSG